MSSVLVLLFSCTSHRKASKILDETDVRGGFIVHIGCGKGKLTSSFAGNEGFMVHGLDTGVRNISAARERMISDGVYGQASVDWWDGRCLPYIDNLVNLIVSEEKPERLSMEEIMRVLVPGGIAYIRDEGIWKKHKKVRTDAIDEWTHYMHDASGNAVARDRRVGPPGRLQWVGSPRWARHHDHMSSLSAMVSAGGRIFYIIDEAPRFSILVPPQWRLVARDAFNGTVLWKKDIPEWFSHLHRLKSGPADLPRRLVATKDRVYVTLGIHEPVTVLDAASGQKVHTCKGSEETREILLSGDVLIAKSGGGPGTSEPDSVRAYHVSTGERLWSEGRPVVKLSLAMDDRHVVFLSGERIICLDKKDGSLCWQSDPVSRAEEYPLRSAPTMVLYKDLVLLAGSGLAAEGNRSWQVNVEDTLTVLSLKDGRFLWKAPHPLSGYASPEDLFVVDDVVWCGETTSGHAEGKVIARDVHTGEVIREFVPDVDTYWFHHRCYRSRSTNRYMMTSRTGIEYIDLENEHWDINHWVRGACLYGVMPANGLTYAPQHPCACFPESKLYGINALAAGKRISGKINKQEERLIKGPAYGHIQAGNQEEGESAGEWPVYRHDNARSGSTQAKVPSGLIRKWSVGPGGRITPPVIAGGRVFVAATDRHTLYAYDAGSGHKLWEFTAGGRIDSPPAVYRDMVLFGSADGSVYNLSAEDGRLIWRFLAAPLDQRLMYFEQLESVWPVHGSVLIRNGVLWFTAGRSMFLDGGIRLYRMVPGTGEVLSVNIMDEKDPQGKGTIQDYVRQLNMPVALPDILSSDEKYIYMRSQPFTPDGKRTPLEALPYAGNPERYSIPVDQNPEYKHLFSPTGFLDDSWWHRTYWVYGSRFLGGWAGYPRAGTVTPAGKLLVFDQSKVYGYGRKPEYYRWTTPMEFRLFAAAKDVPSGEDGTSGGIRYFWDHEVPLMVRAMVLAGDKLFIAGPPDLVDEQEVVSHIDSTGVEAMLLEQQSAFEGKKGGLLWVVSAENGETERKIKTGFIPVMDGMAAAYGKLFISTREGQLVCLGL